MEATIPSSADLRAKLQALSHAETTALAHATEVPFTTLWKIRTGETDNPRIETVRRVWPELVRKATSEPTSEGAAHG